MPSASPTLFPGLFGRQPDLVRSFLRAALQLRDLEDLYAAARLRPGGALSRSLLEVLDVRCDINEQELRRIPAEGPLVMVANHPYGLLDGIVLDHLLLRVRPDVKILTNSLLLNIPELQSRCLPVEVFGRADEKVGRLKSLLRWLRGGGGAAFFPAGEVSSWQPRMHTITDSVWSPAAARCAALTRATVVPIHFAGVNSLGFQLAGLIHPRLRTARLPGELMNKRGHVVKVRIGHPIRHSELSRFDNAESATRYLRARTYTLGQRGQTSHAHLPLPARRNRLLQPIAAPATAQSIRDEAAAAIETTPEIFKVGDYQAIVFSGNRYPALLREIGRLREISFRGAGEGSGKALDLDHFDHYYSHLVLWHKAQGCIAGGYRLGWTHDILPEHGPKGLYTSTLFHFHSSFFTYLGPAVELGRSFIRPEFQKDYAPLLVLWQAIARSAARRPEAPILFGPVSISAGYSQAARELIVRFVSENTFRADLASMVKPRHPFRSRRTNSRDLEVVGSCLRDVEDLAGPLRDLGADSNVPVLLRQYLKMGGRLAGFNVDRHFGNALDGLLIVDLRETAPKMLGRYMGADLAAKYLESVLPARSA